jgi:hypothetical protein
MSPRWFGIVREQGGIDPLEGMAPGLARQVAEDFLSLAVEVQAVFPKGWCQETTALPSGDVSWQPA